MVLASTGALGAHVTFDRTHLYLVWGGGLPGGEIWSNSLRMTGPNLGDGILGVMTAAQLETWVQGDLKDKVQAWHTDAQAHVHGGATLAFVKGNYVNMAGHYVDAITHEHVYSPAVGGSSSAAVHPNQVSLAVSLATGLERGYAHRGRFYMPLPAIVIRTDGMISQGDADEVAGAAARFLTALNDWAGLDRPLSENVAVMSKHGTGATHTVTAVEVGRVMDTQRRRRAEIPENWVTAPVAT